MDDDLRAPFPRPLGRDRLIAFDCLLAVGYTVVLLGLPLRPALVAAAEGKVPAVAVYLVVAGIGLPLALRRLWPRTVFGCVLAASVLSVSLGLVWDAFVAASCALYTVALTTAARRKGLSPIGLLALVGVLVVSIGPVSGDWLLAPVNRILVGAAVLGGTWVVGRAVAERRAYSVRTAERIAERAVTEERLRIARELHDIVAHSMGVIAVKAGVANHVLRERPEEAHDALRVIESTSRDALVEMRHMLGVLRSEVDTGRSGELGPVPGVDRLPEIVDRAAMAGVRVELDVRDVDSLPEGVGLSVYRIVQESVTNVVKHAAPARCWVRVNGDGNEVRIEVTDDGPGPRVLPGHMGAGARHGLVGMRERVMMYGGSFAAERLPDKGFRVAASLRHEAKGAVR